MHFTESPLLRCQKPVPITVVLAAVVRMWLKKLHGPVLRLPAIAAIPQPRSPRRKKDISLLFLPSFLFPFHFYSTTRLAEACLLVASPQAQVHLHYSPFLHLANLGWLRQADGREVPRQFLSQFTIANHWFCFSRKEGLHHRVLSSSKQWWMDTHRSWKMEYILFIYSTTIFRSNVFYQVFF